MYKGALFSASSILDRPNRAGNYQINRNGVNEPRLIQQQMNYMNNLNNYQYFGAQDNDNNEYDHMYFYDDDMDAMYNDENSLINRLDYTISALQNYYDLNAYKKLFNQRMAHYVRNYNDRLSYYYNQMSAASNQFRNIYSYNYYDDDKEPDSNEKEESNDDPAPDGANSDDKNQVELNKVKSEANEAAKKKVEGDLKKQETAKAEKNMAQQAKENEKKENEKQKEDGDKDEQEKDAGKNDPNGSNGDDEEDDEPKADS